MPDLPSSFNGNDTMITESIKDGFSLTNRNLQLVYMRIGVSVINMIGLIIFLAVPLIIAVFSLGMDLAHMRSLMPAFFNNPFEFLSKYLMLLFMAGSAFILYLLFSSLLFIYSLAGILGSLRKAAVNVEYRFSFSSFFREANRNFFTLLRLVLIGILLFIGLTVALILSAGMLAMITQAAGGDTSAEVFFSSFITISVFVLGGLGLFGVYAFMVYAAVVLFVEGGGALDSIKKAGSFLSRKPGAFMFYVALFMAMMLFNLLFFFVKSLFGLLPVLEPLLAVFFVLLNTFFHSYVAVVMWSALIVYYVKAVDYPVYNATYEI